MNDFPKKIPVFPLRGVIFFPETNLPLNIFESRYLKMVNDTLKNNKFLGMIQSKNINGEVYNVGCLGKIDEHNKTEDGRILINLKGITRFEIDKEIKNNEPYREFYVKYDLFRDDTNKRNPEVTNTKFNELINNLKIFFKKNGLLINWAELSKLSLQKQIYNLAMISPISVEEKQKLIEIVKLDDVANILNEITKFNFYEDSEEKKILQ
mgnify:CR=1 FL=1|tara:strand:- start:780 stop:1406 length:627 start_codon:yes stop_codon:yes gene_type:complete